MYTHMQGQKRIAYLSPMAFTLDLKFDWWPVSLTDPPISAPTVLELQAGMLSHLAIMEVLRI